MIKANDNPNPEQLESQEWQERLKSLIQWRNQARIAQAENRREMAIDEDFYDSIQLDDEEMAILQERQQPVLIYNIVKNNINWILGTEKRARVDYKILPRTKDDTRGAKTKTKVFKYIEDCADAPYHLSAAFADAVKAGIGWMDTGIKMNGDSPIFEKHEPWRNMWFDHLGKSLDGSDWRYEIREKWVDLDVTQELFPDFKKALETIANGVNSLYPHMPDDTDVEDEASEFDLESSIDAALYGNFGGARERVKLIEMWYRKPGRIQTMKMVDKSTPYGALDGAPFREDEEEYQYLVKNGYFKVNESFRMVIRQAIWAGRTYLQDIMSPYNHWCLPIIPLFCYRRSRDGMPYGVIRDIRDPQRDLNMRKSKSLFLLNAKQVEYEKGVVDDVVKLHQEINRPDGQIELAEGALSGNKFRRVDHVQEVQWNVEMARDAERFVDSVSGVTQQNKGVTDRDLSGKAVGMLQDQGLTTSGVYFDNYYYTFKIKGEIINSLVEQFMDREQEILITGDQVLDDFMVINQQLDNGEIENCITKSKARFIVGKQDYRESIRLSMYETLSELVMKLSQSMPEVALNLLDMVVDFMDELPQKDELVARIRKLNGQRDPEEEMTPDEKAKAEQEDQAQAQKSQRMQEIEMATAEAKAASEQAKANSSNVDAKMKILDGFLKALEAAGALQMNPGIATAADMLIQESQQSVGGRTLGDNTGGIGNA